MALNLVCAVLDRGPKDLAEMAVLLAIADSADKDSGEAWPSVATIARRARQTDRSVHNVLARLRAADWLTWGPRSRANGSRASNVYTINLQALGEAREGGSAGRSPLNHVQGRALNRVQSPPCTTFRGPPEPRSEHAPERGSPLEPSHHLEPVTREDAARSATPRLPLKGGAALQGEAEGIAVAAMTPFLRAELRAGRSFLLGNSIVKPGTAHFEALAQAAREFGH